MDELLFYPPINLNNPYLQRQDTDDRLRRLQSDKESLVLQVQVLTEQVAAQGEKISELERGLTEKQHLLNNADDLLRRVSLFANLVGVQIDKQKVPDKELTFLKLCIPVNIILYYDLLYASCSAGCDHISCSRLQLSIYLLH